MLTSSSLDSEGSLQASFHFNECTNLVEVAQVGACVEGSNADSPDNPNQSNLIPVASVKSEHLCKWKLALSICSRMQKAWLQEKL